MNTHTSIFSSPTPTKPNHTTSDPPATSPPTSHPSTPIKNQINPPTKHPPVTPRNFYALLEAGEAVLLFPGGARETYHRKG